MADSRHTGVLAAAVGDAVVAAASRTDLAQAMAGLTWHARPARSPRSSAAH